MRSGTTTREKAVKKRKHANTCAEADVTLTYFRLKNTDHADCKTADREQTVQSVQTKCYFHLLVP